MPLAKFDTETSSARSAQNPEAKAFLRPRRTAIPASRVAFHPLRGRAARAGVPACRPAARPDSPVKTLSSLAALLLSVFLLVAGNSLIGVLAPLRASLDQFPDLAIGLLGSVYFAGMLAGTLATPAAAAPAPNPNSRSGDGGQQAAPAVGPIAGRFLLTNVAGKISKKNCRKRNWRSAAQPARAGRSAGGTRRSAPPSHARAGNACQ